MAEYIEREALLEDIAAAETNGGMGAVVAGTLRRYVKRQPAADVAPVRHGRWEQFRLGADDYALRLRCSHCRKVVYERGFSFCPGCGADMRGADNEK